jgi:hypothetical protein
VKQAESALVPSVVKVALGQEHTLAFNRRFHMTDGSVGWNPRKLNPKILKPAGPIDPDVAIVHFEARAGSHRPLATYVNSSSRILRFQVRSSPSWPTGRLVTSPLAEPTRKVTMRL